MNFKVGDKVKFEYTTWSRIENSYTIEGVIEKLPNDPEIGNDMSKDCFWVRIDGFEVDSVDRELGRDFKNNTILFPVNEDELKKNN